MEHAHWHLEPWLLAALGLTLLLYLWGVRPRHARSTREARVWRRQTACFLLGLLVLYGTVASPLDAVAERALFSAHMLQHLLLVYAVPLLVLWGLPGALLEPLVTLPLVAPVWRLATRPLVAFVAFNVVFAAWHLPGLYEWALRDRLLHNLEHGTFLLTAILMWWPLLSPVPRMPRLAPGAQALYLFALSVAQIPVFAYVTFADDVLYPTYAAAPRLLPLSPIEDQQLGGILMKLAGMGVLFAALAVVFWNWSQRDAAPSPQASGSSEANSVSVMRCRARVGCRHQR